MTIIILLHWNSNTWSFPNNGTGTHDLITTSTTTAATESQEWTKEWQHTTDRRQVERIMILISIHIDESGTGTNPPNNTGTTTNYKHKHNGDHRHSESLLLCNKNEVRSLLVKHLSPDAVLALDDAMEEVQLSTAATTTRIGTNPQQQPSFESCTLLQHQWVYACSLKHVEFYMLFHTTHFVTISDVQQEAQHIRKTYFSK